jgi:pimeloyl-ACP methyl ester carboxylesterase
MLAKVIISGIRDNHTRGVVADFIKAKFRSGSRLSSRSWRTTVRAVIRLTFRTMLAPGARPDPAWVEAVEAAYRKPEAWIHSETVALELLSVLRGERPEIHEILTQLPNAHCPVAIARGERDLVVGGRELEEIAALLPNGWFSSLSGVGHCPQNEAPERTAALILDVLRRATQGSDAPSTASATAASPARPDQACASSVTRIS